MFAPTGTSTFGTNRSLKSHWRHRQRYIIWAQSQHDLCCPEPATVLIFCIFGVLIALNISLLLNRKISTMTTLPAWGIKRTVILDIAWKTWSMDISLSQKLSSPFYLLYESYVYTVPQKFDCHFNSVLHENSSHQGKYKYHTLTKSWWPQTAWKRCYKHGLDQLKELIHSKVPINWTIAV